MKTEAGFLTGDKTLHRLTRVLLLLALLAFSISGIFSSEVISHAQSGNVYSCTIVPCYRHPVTGVIEDSGGESSYATGQGMVEGVLGKQGMLEVTDSGKYYLTFRMSLMDYTSKHKFKVQNSGDEKWKKVSMEITKSGKDENGRTADVRVEVPSESCIVRGSMYVDPMGRSVIFYFYPEKYKNGAPSDMKAGIVTESSETGSGDKSSDNKKNTSEQKNGSSEEKGSQGKGSQAKGSQGNGSQVNGSQGNGSQGNESQGNGSQVKGSEEKAGEGNNSGETAPEGNDSESPTKAGKTGGSEEKIDSEKDGSSGNGSSGTSTQSGGVDSSAGLSLSTGENLTDSENDGSLETGVKGSETGTSGGSFVQSEYSPGQWICIITVSILIAGIILMGIAVAIVKYILKNRWKWSDDDDEE